MKVACNDFGINPFDIVLMTNITSILFSTVIVFCSGESFYLEKEIRKPLIIRCIVGLVALISFTIGAALTSITI